MSEPVVSLERVSKRYGNVEAVRGVSWTLEPGAVVGLVGPNGAGKSTTLKMLIGLVRPSSGAVRVMGLDPQRQGRAVRERTGFVPESDALYGWMTVDDALAFSRRLHTSWDKAAAERCLDLFRLPRRRRVSGFSMGMKRQLALTLAVASRPRLLLLDEPTTGLDPERRREFLQVILREVIERGCTVIFSSHQLHEVERLAERVVIMREGRMIREGSVDALKEESREIRVVFQLDPPEDLATWPGVASVSGEGRRRVLQVRGDVDVVLARLQVLKPFAVDVVERNLEEIYFATQGRPPSLEAGRAEEGRDAP